MTFRKTRRVRRVIREALAMLFWLHALYATHLVRLSAQVHLHAPSFFYTLLLLLVIAFYSLLSEYEWLSVAADSLYIYLWPCIAFVKASWLIVKALYRYIRSNVVFQSPGLIVRPSPKIDSPVKTDEPEKVIEARSLVRWFAKPFTEFSVLWSVLILTTENKTLTLIACGVALFSAGRALYELWDLTADSPSWIEKLKRAFADRIAIHIGQIRAWEEMSQLEEVTKAANAVKMLECIFVFIVDNKKFLHRSTILLASIVSIVFYFYISFVFACLYVGLANVQHITWTLSDSFVNSLYMPFAFTNLPRNFPIQFLGGLQALAVTLLGWNIFFRHLNSRFEKIAIAASELRHSFEDKVLRVKLSVIQEQTSKLASAVKVPDVLQTVVAGGLTVDSTAGVPSTGPKDEQKGFRKQKLHKKGK